MCSRLIRVSTHTGRKPHTQIKNTQTHTRRDNVLEQYSNFEWMHNICDVTASNRIRRMLSFCPLRAKLGHTNPVFYRICVYVSVCVCVCVSVVMYVANYGDINVSASMRQRFGFIGSTCTNQVTFWWAFRVRAHCAIMCSQLVLISGCWQRCALCGENCRHKKIARFFFRIVSITLCCDQWTTGEHV